MNSEYNLVGQIVISTPHTDTESCFSKSVVCILSHDKNGALGVIINRVLTSTDSSIVFSALNIKIDRPIKGLSLHFGGPVESEKGLILHTGDYKSGTLINLKGKDLCLSSNTEILKDIASGGGPEDKILMLGYTGWGPGQLEKEMMANSWISAPYSKDLVFSEDNSCKWQAAMKTVGIDPSRFSHSAGNA
jgi:putative transcriptional regulator